VFFLRPRFDGHDEFAHLDGHVRRGPTKHAESELKRYSAELVTQKWIILIFFNTADFKKHFCSLVTFRTL
jgi:hypothetical protein